MQAGSPDAATPAAHHAPPALPVPRQRALAVLQSLLEWINLQVLRVSMLVLVGASCVLTYSVLTRYFLKSATDWQDEVSVFLLVGATFMCCGFVQSRRGHVGIEALASVLPAAVNRVRALVVDAVSTLFCAFFSWKSYTLLHEAVKDGQTTSSTLAAPLWIPYGLMTVGMGLLTLQLLLQTLVRVTGEKQE
jgi:TRAP-type C4-dicarboxylate transport system permease small subunit